MKLNSLIFSWFLFAGALGASGSNVIWESDFSKFKSADSPDKGWVLEDLSEEVSDKGVRMRETGEDAKGTMSCEIKYKSTAKYIQVKAGVAENAKSMFYLNLRGEKYKIYTGYNTFAVNNNDISNGNLKLTISLSGTTGKASGGWADLEWLRVVEKPLDGLTFSILSNGRSDNTAQLGDSLMFKYIPSTSIIEKELEVDCFVTPDMSDYKFCNGTIIMNDKGMNGDEKAGDSIYSCIVKIDETAFAFKSGNGKNILGSVHTGGTNSYAYVPFKININEILDPGTSKIKNKIPPAVFWCANPDIVKYRKLWAQYTRGENIAVGGKIIFSKKPDYSLTAKGDTDATDLTDGKLSTSGMDAIWFDAASAGWLLTGGTDTGINCLLDLGESKPIASVVARMLAGKNQGSLAAPSEFKIFVSQDGKAFYEAASMVKLMQGEKDLSNFKTHYYLDELGKAYVYPFKFEINADARYVGIYIKGETGAVFSDEIAVIAGDKSQTGFNDAYKKTAQKFITSGILVEPRLKELVISTNINTPNSFQISDMRDKNEASKPVSIIVDVPEGINIIAPTAKKHAIEISGNKYSRWELPLKKSMLFFTAEKSTNIKLPAYIYAKSGNVEYEKAEVPVRLIEIPKVEPSPKRLHVSLAWMTEHDQKQYPLLFTAWKHMGFNAIGCFPRYVTEKNKEENARYIDSVRKDGFAVIANESPFSVMRRGHEAGAEIFSQLKSAQKSKNLCPSYTGPFYEKELERVTNCIAITKPDYVFWDIECWYPGAKEAPACIRCTEEQQKSGKSMDEFLKDCGVEKMKRLKEAVRKGIGNGKMPIIHCYDTHPSSPNYDGISDFNRFYPAYVDTSANSFYVIGNAQRVHDEMVENYKLLNNNKCIPWLSTGTYGEFDPYRLEYMILEALLNGASGITYFQYWDFDTPMDFYYHAKTLSEIAPYENIIMDGTVMNNMEVSNRELTYSAVKNGNEMLLLAGNYKRVANGATEIKLPFKNIVEIKDLRDNNNKIKPGKDLKLNVAKDQIILYYIKGNE